MTTITKENIDKFKSYGFILTPVLKSENKKIDKKPKTKNGTWHKDWSEQELLLSERLGVFHKDSKVFAIDPDDKTFIAHKFMSLLPPTFEVGKVVDGIPVNTQRIYRLPEDVTGKKFEYVDTNFGKIIELLPSTQSIIAGVDRIIVNNVEPTIVDPNLLTTHCKLISTFTELFRHFPKGSGKRDEIHLALAGALVRETDIDLDIARKYVERLCLLTHDDEIKKRIDKLDYQKEQLAAGVAEVAGIKSLSLMLGGVNLPAFDLIKKDNDVKEYKIEFPMIDGSTLLNTTYVKPNFILDPILREKSITQISGGYGAGKTHLGLALALSVCHGRDFLDYKIKRSNPILYVEAELCGSDIQERIINLNYPFLEMNGGGSELNPQNQFTLSQDDLINAGIQYGFPDLAVADDETRASVGRLAIENLVERIKEKTGKFPLLFLDNISALTSIDENKAKDWSSFMRWLIKLKSKGTSSVIFHHINKSTGSASGSNMSQRLIDTHLILQRLDEDHRFDIRGKSVQCSVHFDKFRNFGGERVKPFMLTCNEDGIWNKYPMLDQINVKIIAYHNQGLSIKEMCEQEEEWKDKTIYKRFKKLKEDKIIDETKR